MAPPIPALSSAQNLFSSFFSPSVPCGVIALKMFVMLTEEDREERGGVTGNISGKNWSFGPRVRLVLDHPVLLDIALRQPDHIGPISF